jgi:hypothetical protein
MVLMAGRMARFDGKFRSELARPMGSSGRMMREIAGLSMVRPKLA